MDGSSEGDKMTMKCVRRSDALCEGDLRCNGPLGFQLGLVGRMRCVPTSLKFHTPMLFRQPMVPAKALPAKPAVPDDPLSGLVTIDGIPSGIGSREFLVGR